MGFPSKPNAHYRAPVFVRMLAMRSYFISYRLLWNTWPMALFRSAQLAETPFKITETKNRESKSGRFYNALHQMEA